MMTFLEAMPIGNAVRVFLSPPAGAENWVVLRNTTGIFSAYNDPTATQVFAGSNLTIDNVFMDTDALVNGNTYYYGDFSYNGTVWTAGTVMSVDPASTYTDQSVDMLVFLRTRIQAALTAEIARGLLTLPPDNTKGITVLNAPPLFETTTFPVVTVHLLKDAPEERFIGEQLIPDTDTAGVWQEGEGWLSRWTLAVVGWTLNPDERIALRQSLKRIVIGNLPIFNAVGAVQVDFSMEDVDLVTGYPAPVYQAMGTFTCLAPSLVTDNVGSITSVTATGSAEG